MVGKKTVRRRIRHTLRHQLMGSNGLLPTSTLRNLPPIASPDPIPESQVPTNQNA